MNAPARQRGRPEGRAIATGSAPRLAAGTCSRLISHWGAAAVDAQWLNVSLWEALVMDLGLVVFFLVYTFVFNWVFDHVFGLPASAAPRTPASVAGQGA